MKPRLRKLPRWWREVPDSQPATGDSPSRARACQAAPGSDLRVEETILGLKQEGHRGVFVQPIGFLCDHVEVLYDIDIGFKEFAGKEGLQLWRAESLNDSPLLTAALAELARSRINDVTGRSVPRSDGTPAVDRCGVSMQRIAIIGGGISGLAAAFALEERRQAGAPLEYALYRIRSAFRGRAPHRTS